MLRRPTSTTNEPHTSPDTSKKPQTKIWRMTHQQVARNAWNVFLAVDAHCFIVDGVGIKSNNNQCRQLTNRQYPPNYETKVPPPTRRAMNMILPIELESQIRQAGERRGRYTPTH